MGQMETPLSPGVSPTSPLVSHDIVSRPYDRKDDEAINELEKRATQHRQIPIVSSLFQASIRHITSFDAKAKQFDDHRIICLEDRKTGTLCGVVACGIKEVFLQGQKRRCGYVYDLRIHEDYQGKGLGSLISNDLEFEAKKAGVEFFYLTVNGDNAKAKALYRKLGFQHASTRYPMAELLLQEVSVPTAAPPVKVLAKDEARQLFQEAYQGRDMSLVNMGSLFDSPLFEAALLCEDPSGPGTSCAGACMWNAGSFHAFSVDRFFIPTRWLSLRFTKVVCACTGLLCTAWMGHGLWTLLLGAWDHGERWWATIGMVVCLGLGFCIARFMARWGPPFLTILSKLQPPVVDPNGVVDDSEVPRTRCRLFAPFARGPRGPELLQAVVAHAQNEARSRGYVFLICNLDISDPHRACFGPGRFKTQFLQKTLVADLSPKDFASDSFHDPRDI